MSILPKFNKSVTNKDSEPTQATDLSMAYNIHSKNRKKAIAGVKSPDGVAYKPQEQAKSILEGIRSKFASEPLDLDDDSDLLVEESIEDIDLEQESENIEDLKSVASKIRAKLRAGK